ncbi:hypothetical protein An08g05750 [Aspergillus niger]|uniref:Uncharacterized protein n=2 Tax=Aspergillus niger TaxID=5061 RepID=A2QRE6_ASPNC|nr:hypothetical protein An08g05750 [Aspergillus niger]CAK45547.1 hypothetical protein An08g05750 [Aspergillus niger]
MNSKAAVLRRKLSPVGAIVGYRSYFGGYIAARTVTVGTFHHGTAAKYCGHGDTAEKRGQERKTGDVKGGSGSTGTSGHSMIPASGEFGDYILESVAEKLLDGIRNGITCDHFLQSPREDSHDTLPSPPSTGAEITSAYANPQIIDFQIILNLGGARHYQKVWVPCTQYAVDLGVILVYSSSAPDPIDCDPTAA